MNFSEQITAVVALLGPDAVVFESATLWEIGICRNHRKGPPYDIEVYGTGETFEAAYTQAARAAAKVGRR